MGVFLLLCSSSIRKKSIDLASIVVNIVPRVKREYFLWQTVVKQNSY